MNNTKEYKCICGKIFYNSQSYIAHQRHCTMRLTKEQHEQDVLKLKSMLPLAIAKCQEIKERNDLQKQKNWELTGPHFCKNCGAPLPNDYKQVLGTKQFCSRACANTRHHTEETKNKIREGVAKSEKINKFLQNLRDEYYKNPRKCVICHKTLSYEERNKHVCSSAECKEKYKIWNINLSEETARNTYCTRAGFYHGIFMASTWELAYYLWACLHKIPITRCTYDQRFNYQFQGKSRTYRPDFLINKDTFIEIKGRGKWYDEDEVKAKIQAVKSCNKKINIYYREDLKTIFKEVCDYYKVKNTIELAEKFYDK